ncbi:hypothetical protein [Vibrio mimicus]|uniref:Uncharacterized protein n=1 Tax=Vibrio mimicus TaxID=674 RepID=A0A2J9V3I0_VIBMI|nr:hypothetical protein [Vibrio mimicus]EEW09518.1 hypothetical protein VMD_29080 [Vibrio mimicus VM573]EGU18631.1 hypothetical protein SX4_3710 [Vibrio mimicus SX-4]KFE30691.1 hypothetical protein DN31_2682 [Vibrio mimicus]PNM58320.1 hypothetical protein AL544_020805 [Vibrio mimicus]
MKISLQAYQPLPVLISGQWVHLEAAQQAVVLESSNGDRVTMRHNAVIKSEQTIGRVLVHSEIDQEISLEFGYGDFTPPQVIEGQTIVVSQLPAVEFAPNQSVGVSQLPAIKFAPDQNVAVSQLPAIELAANQSLAVTQLPAVELKPDQVLKLEVSEQLTARESVMPFSVAANTQRSSITLKAKATNTADILINGAYPLSAGEKLELKTRAAIELTGATTDSVAILEW